MLSLQAGMNTKVDPNWVEARYPYMRAVVIEAAEAIEHHGWKWWKKQDKDLPQLQMELIDIWHFILSQILLDQQGEEQAAHKQLDKLLSEADTTTGFVFEGDTVDLKTIDLISKLEMLIAISVVRRIDLKLFSAILSDCEMTWTELYRQYVGKNVLNFFRQDRGYQQGSYQKLWNGREDNEYLVDILSTLDVDDPLFKEQIYSALDQHYPS